MKKPTRLWNRVAAAFEKTGALSNPRGVRASVIAETLKRDLDLIAEAKKEQEDISDDES